MAKPSGEPRVMVFAVHSCNSSGAQHYNFVVQSNSASPSHANHHQELIATNRKAQWAYKGEFRRNFRPIRRSYQSLPSAAADHGNRRLGAIVNVNLMRIQIGNYPEFGYQPNWPLGACSWVQAGLSVSSQIDSKR